MREQRGQPSSEDRSTWLEATRVLATKLYAPPAREKAIARPRLADGLLAGVNRPGTFTLVSGPAGFGKTTLLSEFVARCPQPVAWVSLDGGDNDPRRFWTYLLTACQSIVAGVGDAAQELFDSPQPLPDQAIPTLLINELSAQDRPLVLVLDDYHVIQAPAIHAGLGFLLEHLPPTLHLIVSTRIDPPWPLARFRARNQLIELRAQDLRFSADEAAAFLNHTMGLQLSAEDASALEARTEGWIAGLQLAGLSLQGRGDVADFIRAFTGSHVYVAEYLFEEILQKQPEDVQAFLLQTSILDRLTAALCEAVTDGRDGQTTLTGLHRANIFIIPLDQEGRWFRYHHLFADLLRARLHQQTSAEAIAALHLRAAEWYAAQGLLGEAIPHALAARDFERAASLLDEVSQSAFLTDRYAGFKGWLDALPEEVFQTHPRLEIYRFMIALSQGTLDMYEATLRDKERLIKALPPSPENDRLRLEAMVYLSLFLAHHNTARTIAIAREALAELPESESRLRAFLHAALYRAYGMDGDIARSAPAYEESLRLAQAAGQYGMISVTTMVRAFDLCQYGRLEEAAHYCRVILDVGARLKRKVFYPAGPAYIGLGGVFLEWHDLGTAEDDLTRGIGLCQQGGTDGLYTGYIQLARLRQAQGDFDGAEAILQRLEQTLQRWDFTLAARQVSLRLARGDVASAAQLIAPLQQVLGESFYARQLPLIAQEAFTLCLARIALAQGELDQTRQLLDEVEVTAAEGQRDGRLLEVNVLRALAECQAAGTVTPAAIDALERALDLGEPGGFVLLFLEEGPGLIPLLAAIVQRRAPADRLRQYAQRLLDAFAATGRAVVPSPPGSAPGLVEALTPREMEVLLRIATGDSNQAIADQLVITVRTVKKHTTNILGKLDARNRTQAVARARELGLLASD